MQHVIVTAYYIRSVVVNNSFCKIMENLVFRGKLTTVHLSQ